MRMHRSGPWTQACAAWLLAAAGAAAGQPTITNLGLIPGTTESAATGLSADGTVVGGYCVIDHIGGNSLAFRWTSSGGMQNLGGLSGGAISSRGMDISADGAVLVGTAGALSVAPRAWRWTAAAGMQSLGTMQGGADSNATGISANGLVIVGFGEFQNSSWNRAFRWTAAGGMQHLGTLAGGNLSRAYAANGDGSVVTGFSNGTTGTRAFRWTSAGGMQSLGTLTGGWSSEGWAINPDGLVIVGVGSGQGFSQQAMRWTSAGGMQHLGALPGGMYSSASVVSADGSVVLGDSSGTGINQYHAVRWTAAEGMVDLNAWFAARGVDMAGWELEHATGLSADGSAICGTGRFNGEVRAWLVTGLDTSSEPCYANCDASTVAPCLNVSDFGCFLNKFAGGDSNANCDASTTAPLLNVQDFGCFLNKFATGCSGC